MEVQNTVNNAKPCGKLFLVLAAVLLYTGCAVKVNTSYDPSASFKDYETFCWFDNCEFTIDGPFYVNKDSATVKQFQNAIVDELLRKGYTYDQNNPDFLLHLVQDCTRYR